MLSYETVRTLVAAGGDVQLADTAGDAPLHHAARARHVMIVGELFAAAGRVYDGYFLVGKRRAPCAPRPSLLRRALRGGRPCV